MMRYFSARRSEGLFRKADCRELYPLLPGAKPQQERHAACFVNCTAADLCEPRVRKTDTFGDNCKPSYSSHIQTVTLLSDPARPNVPLAELRLQPALASSPIDFTLLGVDELDINRLKDYPNANLTTFSDIGSLSWTSFCEKWRDNDTMVSFRAKLPNGAIITLSGLVITSGDQLIETAPGIALVVSFFLDISSLASRLWDEGHSYMFNNGTFKVQTYP